MYVGRARPTIEATSSATTPGSPWILLELLVRSDLVSGVAHLTSISIVGTLFPDDRYILAVHWTTTTPRVPSAMVSHTLVGLVQIIDEISLVVLASNDTLLSASHSWGEHTIAWSHLLGRFVDLISHCQSCQSHLELLVTASVVTLGLGIERLVLVVPCVQEQGLQAERFAFEPTVLNVVV